MKRWIVFGLMLVIVSGCSESTRQDFIERGDVVDVHGAVSNVEKLEQFMENRDEVTVVRYTTEGDPIFYTLRGKDGGIFIKRNTKQDDYGPKGISTAVCHTLTKEGHSFVLNGCEGDFIGDDGRYVLLKVQSERTP
ncbi:MAG TPA: DUF4362 domain-containing protein [Bacillales bacterium]|nr:DUF4362 domain-containing protein [Bacillales bacterium]